ncbi:hypothetical protein BD410DRAFT_837346 [Rickenella mellea]|uniref:Uncharacterized protein n=1 Tax=Rickenella mellea TaxID=50990 RepID=A0A4Y7QE02_9AGAM|nr:hypothetical protein BD410DRAFT_837346 [Rickenella mellea]
MPELAECWASNHLLCLFVIWLQIKDISSRRLHGIWLDGTAKEQEHAALHPSPSNARLQAGLVYRLDPNSSPPMRGQSKKQKPVLPEQYRDVDSSLVLKDVLHNARNVILDFTTWFVQIQLFTHCLPQIYSLEDWYGVICNVPKSTRGFKVGLAFELKDWVIAFTSLDLLIGIHWAQTRLKLPAQHVDIFTHPILFIKLFLHWIDKRCQKYDLRHGAVIYLLRSECHLFAGIGVYTICEIFFIAGISPFISEREMFLHPSRIARFVAAYWVWSKFVRENVPDLMRNSVYEWKVAVNKETRHRWLSHLKVFGKENVVVSQRFKTLVARHNIVATDQPQRTGIVYDAFEPTWLYKAFECFPVLGKLTFGLEMWHKLKPSNNTDQNHTDDDDIHFFWKYFTTQRFGLRPPNASLDLNFYLETGGLRLSDQEMGTHRCNIFLYTINKKNVWTVLHQLSHFGRSIVIKGKSISPPKIVEATDEVRLKRIGRYIIDCTDRHFIGPLDYAGTSFLIMRTGKRNTPEYIVLICPGDHRAGLFYQNRIIRKCRKATPQDPRIIWLAAEQLRVIMVERGINITRKTGVTDLSHDSTDSMAVASIPNPTPTVSSDDNDSDMEDDYDHENIDDSETQKENNAFYEGMGKSLEAKEIEDTFENVESTRKLFDETKLSQILERFSKRLVFRRPPVGDSSDTTAPTTPSLETYQPKTTRQSADQRLVSSGANGEGKKRNSAVLGPSPRKTRSRIKIGEGRDDQHRDNNESQGGSRSRAMGAYAPLGVPQDHLHSFKV